MKNNAFFNGLKVKFTGEENIQYYTKEELKLYGYEGYEEQGTMKWLDRIIQEEYEGFREFTKEVDPEAYERGEIITGITLYPAKKPQGEESPSTTEQKETPSSTK